MRRYKFTTHRLHTRAKTEVCSKCGFSVVLKQLSSAKQHVKINGPIAQLVRAEDS